VKRCLLFLVLTAACVLSYAAMPERDVGVALYLNDITEIRPQDEIIDLDATVFLRWQSERKPLETEYYYGNAVDEALKTMWWPYFKFLQTRGAGSSSLQALTIAPDGRVDYAVQLNLKIETDLDMHKFPFDKQVIHIGMSAFGDMPYKINYYLLQDKIGINPAAHLDEWELVKTKNKISANNGMQFKMTLYYQRQAGFYIYKIFLPLMMIVVISFLVLWLPRQPAINRLGTIITAMLTVVAFQWAVSADIPKVSYVTYFQGLILFTFLTIGSIAFFIVWGDRIPEDKTLKLMRRARLAYPVVFLLGMGLISFLWFGLN